LKEEKKPETVILDQEKRKLFLKASNGHKIPHTKPKNKQTNKQQ
jgi:hypothetical protein